MVICLSVAPLNMISAHVSVGSVLQWGPSWISKSQTKTYSYVND